VGIHLIAKELRNAQCKFYVEPSVKKGIENFAQREGLSFSEACRALVLNSEELKHELNIIAW
jgi:predicted DNA-binding protein (UPF0278 family)